MPVFCKNKKKISEERLLEAYDLGVDRVMRELSERLEANKKEYYEGEEIDNGPDNATRMRATQLLADLNGLKEIKINHTGDTHNPLVDELRELRKVYQHSDDAEQEAD